MASATHAMQVKPVPMKVRICWHRPGSLEAVLDPPKVDFFDFEKGFDAAHIIAHKTTSEAKKDVADFFEYELQIPREKMLVGTKVGGQTTCFQMAPGFETRVIHLPVGSMATRAETAIFRIRAEEYVPGAEAPRKTKPLQGATFSAELVEVSRSGRLKKPERAKEHPISSPVTQGRVDLEVGASGLYKVNLAVPGAYRGSNPSLPFFVYVSGGEVVELTVVFEPFAELAEITGSLIDEKDQPFAERRVLIHSADGKMYEARTDKKGHFRQFVPKGNYDVFVDDDEVGSAIPVQTITVG